jgi:hypothetical protein
MIMGGPFIVYGLLDPRPGWSRGLRYVGKSTWGIGRPQQHLRPYARTKSTHLGCWLRALDAHGLTPEIVLLQTCSSAQDVAAAEIEWIRMSRTSGAALVNHTDGGEGTTGRRQSAETRAKIAAVQRGRRASEATRAKMSQTRKGRSVPPATREKMSLASKRPMLGRRHSEETRTKMSISQKHRYGLRFLASRH